MPNHTSSWCKMFSKITALITQFLSTKTKREKILLFIAIMALCAFIMMEFIYLPLLQTQSTLSRIHNHTLNELTLSLDSMQSAKAQHQQQTNEVQNLQEEIFSLQQSLSHTTTLEPLLNPFTLIPSLINFAKNENLSLNAFHPHPTLNAIDIEGSGEFWQILNLLSFLENYHFVSLESLELSLQEHNQIHFHLLIMDIRQALPHKPQQQIKE
ncbi:hypothetical protein [Helicobacter cinaedi]|uniref:hypothetical protein n=1 Tax=Helicobacter cinaedi TaxID=213 RepID=UPI001F3B2CB1|nr:hypothetical protein [Helicobacter cinaedi]